MNEVDPGRTPTPRKSGCGTYFLIGCSILLVLGIVAGVVIAMNFESIVVSGICFVAEQAVADQNLPQEQKDRIVQQIRRLKTEHKAGRVSREDLVELVEGFGEGPLIAAGLVLVVEENYVRKSGLSAEEQAQAAVSLRRFGQGLVDGVIDRDAVTEVAGPMMEVDASGAPKQLKKHVTDEELREVIAAAKARADEANVSETPREVDIAAEVERVVDRVLNKGPGEADSTHGSELERSEDESSPK